MNDGSSFDLYEPFSDVRERFLQAMEHCSGAFLVENRQGKTFLINTASIYFIEDIDV